MKNLDLELAINENDLAALSFEIEDYVDRISDLFDRYDTVINRLSTSYKGDSCKKILSYYENVKKSFSTVKSNIKSYAKDYQELIKILKSADRKFAGIIDNMATQINNKAANAYVENKNGNFN